MTITKIDDGLEYTIKEDYILLRINKKKFVGKSASGKMDFLCNTHGWTDIAGFTANIMIGKKNEKPIKTKSKKKADLKDESNWKM